MPALFRRLQRLSTPSVLIRESKRTVSLLPSYNDSSNSFVDNSDHSRRKLTVSTSVTSKDHYQFYMNRSQQYQQQRRYCTTTATTIISEQNILAAARRLSRQSTTQVASSSTWISPSKKMFTSYAYFHSSHFPSAADADADADKSTVGGDAESQSNKDEDGNGGDNDDENQQQESATTDVVYDFTPPPPLSKTSQDKVKAIFDEVLFLDMIEVHLLTQIVNERMGISWKQTEQAMLGGGGFASNTTSSAGSAADGPVEEKTIFDLKLIGFDAKAKIKVIKEVRNIAGLGLKEAKELVEGAPKIIQKELKKEKAEELKTKLELVGAQIELV